MCGLQYCAKCQKFQKSYLGQCNTVEKSLKKVIGTTPLEGLIPIDAPDLMSTYGCMLSQYNDLVLKTPRYHSTNHLCVLHTTNYIVI